MGRTTVGLTIARSHRFTYIRHQTSNGFRLSIQVAMLVIVYHSIPIVRATGEIFVDVRTVRIPYYHLSFGLFGPFPIAHDLRHSGRHTPCIALVRREHVIRCYLIPFGGNKRSYYHIAQEGRKSPPIVCHTDAAGTRICQRRILTQTVDTGGVLVQQIEELNRRILVTERPMVAITEDLGGSTVFTRYDYKALIVTEIDDIDIIFVGCYA